MKKISKKLSLLLVLMMGVSLISMSVFAQEVDLPKDVSQGKWYYDAVNYVVGKGLMDLEVEEQFNPSGDVGLNTLYKSLFRLEKELSDSDDELELERWVNESGLNKGLEVKDSESINRAELALILYNYLNKHNIKVWDEVYEFIDAEGLPEWSKEPFRYLINGGFLVGRNGSLAPNDNLKRSELAKLHENISNMFLSSTSGVVLDISKHGNATIDLYTQNLLNAGFELGDILKIKIGDLEFQAPFVSNYSDVDNDEMLVRGSKGISTSPIVLAINMGDFAKYTAASKGDKVTFEILEKAGYFTEWEIRQLYRSNDREDYDSDITFANFRNPVIGNLAKGVYYRSSSPVNNLIGRASYVDFLIKEAGIKTIINLADSEEEIEKHFAAEDFNSPYYKELYDNGQVIVLDMSVDFKADDFKEKLKLGLEFLLSNEGPFLIHCNEGKDRAGFVAGLLESLMGASVEEIKEDYMVTYLNYYHIEEGSEQYNRIAETNILESLRHIAGLEKGASLEGVDRVKASEDYLLKIGLSREEIEKTKIILSSIIEIGLLDIVA